MKIETEKGNVMFEVYIKVYPYNVYSRHDAPFAGKSEYGSLDAAIEAYCTVIDDVRASCRYNYYAEIRNLTQNRKLDSIRG